MATYIVRAPNQHQVEVKCKLGTHVHNHGAYMYDDKLAALFPSIYVKISENSPFDAVEELPTVEEIKAIEQEAVVEEPAVEEPATEEVAEEEETPATDVKIAASTGLPAQKRGPKPKAKE